MNSAFILKYRIKEAKYHQKEAVSRVLEHGDFKEASKVARGYKNLISFLYLSYLKIR